MHAKTFHKDKTERMKTTALNISSAIGGGRGEFDELLSIFEEFIIHRAISDLI